MLKGTQLAPSVRVRYRFGTADFDSEKLELRVGGQLVDVQRKPLQILAELLTHAGTIVTREQLLDCVWNGRPVVDNVIASAITKLRIALGADNASFLVTHPRVGYRWCGVVETVPAYNQGTRVAFEPGMLVPDRTDFVLTEKLESGTHNEVWIARHKTVGELRVYKFALTTEGLSALRREAALLQILRQSVGERAEIVHAPDWSFESSSPFVAYRYAGVNLQQWATTNATLATLSLEARLEVFLKIAAAVEAAHAAGIVHQDIKPQNIMIRARDEGDVVVQLTDFGSGRLLQSERVARMRITQFGLLNAEALTACSSSATPLYLAPELLACQPASEQSDIYALGVLLYQLLARDLRIPLGLGWERHIHDELLREDIARATDLDPAQRFASVAELRARLLRLEERRSERQQQFEREQARIIQHEHNLRVRARRGWMTATLILSTVALIQAVMLVTDAVN